MNQWNDNKQSRTFDATSAHDQFCGTPFGVNAVVCASGRWASGRCAPVRVDDNDASQGFCQNQMTSPALGLRNVSSVKAAVRQQVSYQSAFLTFSYNSLRVEEFQN